MALITREEVEVLRAERIEELKRLKREGKKVVGYFCQYVPVELIFAAGAIPVRLARGNYFSSVRGERFLRPDACPFCKSCLGKFETDPLYRLTDALVFVNTCDMMRRLPEAVSANIKIPIFQLYLPRTAEPFPNRVQGFERQIMLLKAWLTGLTGEEVKEERVLTAITQYNSLRQAISQIDEGRALVPPRVKGSEIFGLALLAWLLEPQKASRVLLRHSSTPTSTSNYSAPRVLLAGSILAEEERDLIELIEEGADIVADVVCTGARFFAGSVELQGNPFHSLAHFYFNRIPCAYRRPNNLLYDKLKQLILERAVQGIIYKTLLYCDPWRFEAKFLRQTLGLPVLEIDGDYSQTNREQLRTRIEAFVEMLK
ncbi:MAG: 2-hydroxyacyl-CoA dehydratase family protein [candidate division WOR-3 bacterium]